MTICIEYILNDKKLKVERILGKDDSMDDYLTTYVEDMDTYKDFISLYRMYNNGFIRNLDKLKLYYSNIFFAKFSDSNRMNYGIEAEVELPLRLSLIINLGQVYYDSNNIIDNNIDKMTNSSINLKYNF